MADERWTIGELAERTTASLRLGPSVLRGTGPHASSGEGLRSTALRPGRRRRRRHDPAPVRHRVLARGGQGVRRDAWTVARRLAGAGPSQGHRARRAHRPSPGRPRSRFSTPSGAGTPTCAAARPLPVSSPPRSPVNRSRLRTTIERPRHGPCGPYLAYVGSSVRGRRRRRLGRRRRRSCRCGRVVVGRRRGPSQRPATWRGRRPDVLEIVLAHDEHDLVVLPHAPRGEVAAEVERDR